jgi:hypothetical protein
VNKGGQKKARTVTERPCRSLAAIKPIIARQSFCTAFRFDAAIASTATAIRRL